MKSSDDDVVTTYQNVEVRKPNRAVIKCHHRDDYVEEFVNWYALMGLKYSVVIDTKRSDIEVDLFLGEELLDQLGCPHGELTGK